MRSAWFGNVLLAAGVVAGVAAVLGLAVGFEPSKLPAALVDIAAYKLAFGAAAGLLVVGAWIRRSSKRSRQPDGVGERRERGGAP
jgi:hypothetical protein